MIRISVVLAVGCVGTALALSAYRSAPEIQTGHGSAPSMLSVLVGSSREAPLYPGGAGQKLRFTVTGRRGHQTLARVDSWLVVDRSTGQLRAGSGEVIRGCLARWFRVRPDPTDPALPVTLQRAGDTYTGTVDLQMVDAPVNQNACERRAPIVSVGVSP